MLNELILRIFGEKKNEPKDETQRETQMQPKSFGLLEL